MQPLISARERLSGETTSVPSGALLYSRADRRDALLAASELVNTALPLQAGRTVRMPDSCISGKDGAGLDGLVLTGVAHQETRSLEWGRPANSCICWGSERVFATM